MGYFTTEEKRQFKTLGYVCKENIIPEDIRSKASDVVWDIIEADRNDPETWIEAGPKGNLPCSNHEDIGATVHHTPVYQMAEELTGPGRLGPPGNPLCKMQYPTGHDDWEPPHGHLDGLTDPDHSEAWTFSVGVTMNIADVAPRSGGFTCWEGSHEKVAEHFRQHSLLTGYGINKEQSPPIEDRCERYEHAAPAGSVVFWHHYMLHSASMNCGRDIRMAFVTRFRFTNLHDIMFDLPFHLWDQWDGLKDVALSP
ncbi:phytanoyl-CoA dioxygenase family protein [bacterium]|jgi:hypothetical protein|nr:phytanoyl-CoA dioxygenase family protein [bacterium]